MNKHAKRIVDRVSTFALHHNLVEYGGCYLVALSGGADSVALLHVMKALESEWHVTLHAAHCNFHLRGEESERDELFCCDLCKRLGVPLHLASFATKEHAELHGQSIEMAARELRYGYFCDLCRDIDAKGVCVAHHSDDSVETVLLNLVRGTGIRGLRGIQPKNIYVKPSRGGAAAGNDIIDSHERLSDIGGVDRGVCVIRPMLCLDRKEIETFLNALGEHYVTDSTNLVNDVKRNKIRLDVLPLLETLNPSVRRSIMHTSLRLTEAMKVFDHAMDKSVRKVTGMDIRSLRRDSTGQMLIDIARLRQQPSPEYTLFEILALRGFSPLQIEQIAVSLGLSQSHDTESRQDYTHASTHACVGRTWMSASHELAVDRTKMIVRQRAEVRQRPLVVPETGRYVFDYRHTLVFSLVQRSEHPSFVPSREIMRVTVDGDKARFPFKVRPVMQGDRFVPFGMKGSKLIMDYLTDKKKNVFEKLDQLVVLDAEDRVVWLVGERVDNRVRIDEDTALVLVIECLSSS